MPAPAPLLCIHLKFRLWRSDAPSAAHLHVLRAPVGGLFRHVVDLARGQAGRGHRVGLVVDSSTCGSDADDKLAKLAPALALGVPKVAIDPQLRDV